MKDIEHGQGVWETPANDFVIDSIPDSNQVEILQQRKIYQEKYKKQAAEALALMAITQTHPSYGCER